MGADPALTDLVPSTQEEERVAYEAYCVRQVRALVGLLPREAIRPMYRKALEAGAPESADDPLGTLADFCSTILPLPPIDVWRDDRERFPEAHLHDMEVTPFVPTAAEPVTLEARFLPRVRGAWTARLRGYRSGEGWRGFIAFEDGTSGRTHQTAPIFREPDPVELRSRFLSFEPATLEAFLRSALP